MRQYEMCEAAWKGESLRGNWAEASFDVTFTCGEKEQRIKGFYAGDGIYKVRFLPDVPGMWTYKAQGAVSGEGSLLVEPAKKNSHGIVRADGCHFRHQDGTYHYPFGTTIYALMHQSRELVEETFASLEKAPFNKVRFCVFPKHYDFNHNEPELFAFEKDDEGRWDVTRPCLKFWDYMDEIMERLNGLGIQADLILFHPYDRWGFMNLTREESAVYLSYCIRRLAAYPNVWWSMSNEYDFVYTKTMEDWYAIEEQIGAQDPYGHLLSNHNCFERYDFTRKNITHCSIQAKTCQRVAEWRSFYKKPVSIDECCYEGNIIHQWGSISPREMTYRFWRTVALGGYCTHGETYYAKDDVLWWARGGQLKGESPERIAFCREIIESLPGPIDPVKSRMDELMEMGSKEREERLSKMTDMERAVVRARLRMSPEERRIFSMFEFTYGGHVGEEAYLTFFDIRTCAKTVMNLPSDKKYKVELIDVYEMTRETLPGEFSGNDEISMPGREGMALLAVRVK